MVILQPFMSWWVIIGLFSLLVLGQVVRLLWLRKKQKVKLLSRRIVIPFLCTVLSFIMIIGPSVPGHRLPAGMINLDVVMVVDTTPSMSALDYNGQSQRRDGVRNDIEKLQKQLVGARVAIIAVDETAHTELPFTTDSSTVVAVAKTIDTYVSTYSTGSSLDKAVDVAVEMLKKSESQHPTRSQVLFYFGDGEQDPQKKRNSFAPIQPYIKGGGVLGYGTEAGGKMKLFSQDMGYEDKYSINRYVTQFDSSAGYVEVPVISKINQANLKDIASELKIPYSHRTSPSEPLDVFMPSITRIASETREIEGYNNLYWVAAILLYGVLLWWVVLLAINAQSIYRARKDV